MRPGRLASCAAAGGGCDRVRLAYGGNTVNMHFAFTYTQSPLAHGRIERWLVLKVCADLVCVRHFPTASAQARVRALCSALFVIIV